MWQITQDPVSGIRKVQFAKVSGIVPPVEITVSSLNLIPLFVDNAHRDYTVFHGNGLC